MITNADKSYLTAAQIAQKLSLSKAHIHRLVSQKKIPFIKLNRTLRFDPEKIDAWVEASSITPEEPAA